LAKSANLSLEKRGLADHTAAVALCMDVSGSMLSMFLDGTVQSIIERVLALGINFDDNGAIDLFAFASKAQRVGELELAGFQGASGRIQQATACGFGTNYAPAVDLILSHYGFLKTASGGLLGRVFGGSGAAAAPPPAGQPVYVLFVTDGDCADYVPARASIVRASEHPIFFQFVGIGTSKFDFLEEIDKMPGRRVDNASFFAVRNPKTVADAELYEKMMLEYPAWLTAVRRAGILK
jgi:hypothetical protein